MFLLTDCTVTPTKTVKLNDIRDIGDVIIGISNDEERAKKAMTHAGDMHFGDSYMVNPIFILDCVQDDT